MSRAWAWGVLAVAFVVAGVTVAYPIYVIRPFRAQGAEELQLALAVTRWRFPVAFLAAAAGILAAWMLRERGRGARIAAAVLAMLTFGFTALTRVNVYEIMFHRIDAPAFIPAAEAKVDTDDMVLAVRAGGANRAYPVRTLTYHHLVNDQLDDAALVATY
jgi:hypothetical protein